MRLLVAFSVLALAASSVQALEWPQFHGDELHTGAVDSNFAPPTERWWSQSTGGPIEGSPVVSDGRVFVGSTDGKLYAFDAISGSPLWTFDTGGPLTGTPALSGGVLYVVNNAGDLFAIDAVTGKKRLSDGVASEPPGRTRTSPAIHEGRLYLGTESGGLVAYNLRTLSKDWEFKVAEEQEAYSILGVPSNTASYQCRSRFSATPIQSSPAVYNNTVFFGSDAHALFAVNEFGFGGSKAGKTSGIWTTFPTNTPVVYTCQDPIPVGTSGNVSLRQAAYVPGDPLIKDVIRASPAIDAANRLVIVASYDNIVRAFDIRTGSERWNKTVAIEGNDSRVISTPAVKDGRVYFGSFNGHFYALESIVTPGTNPPVVTGVRELWNVPVGDAIWSSPAVSNGLVAFGADDETVYVLDAKTGANRWDPRVAARVGGDVRSSPAIWTGEYLTGKSIAGGVLYVGSSDGILYAFGGEKPPLPDLKVLNVTFPNPPPLDGDSDVVIEVTNAGNSTSPATELKLFIDDALASTQPVIALAPGEVANLTYRWHVTGGEHNLKVQVDPAGVSREFDRANNELLVKTPQAQSPPAPPPPPEETNQTSQPAPKKKSPGFEVAGLAAALALVAVAARRRKR